MMAESTKVRTWWRRLQLLATALTTLLLASTFAGQQLGLFRPRPPFPDSSAGRFA